MHKDKSIPLMGDGSSSTYPDVLGARKWTLPVSLLILSSMYLLYAPVMVDLAKTWWARDDYSHGFLVPLISLYLIWHRRELLDRDVLPAFPWGLSVVAVAGIMFVLGDAGGVITLQALSLVVMIAGLVLSRPCWGRAFWGRWASPSRICSL
jgi:hypothetical protein